jgi:hypothetical protein
MGDREEYTRNHDQHDFHLYSGSDSLLCLKDTATWHNCCQAVSVYCRHAMRSGVTVGCCFAVDVNLALRDCCNMNHILH